MSQLMSSKDSQFRFCFSHFEIKMELLGNLLVTVFIVRWRICLTPFGLVLFPWSFQTCSARAGWFLGLGANNKKTNLPDTVKVGDPVLHEPAQDVDPIEIKLERVQKIIDDMIQVMRKASGVGLAAPQIGIPLRVTSILTIFVLSSFPILYLVHSKLKIIVLEDTKEYISYVSKEEAKTQDRRPADLLVILNPKLDKKGKRIALFFEGCLRCPSLLPLFALSEKEIETIKVSLENKTGDLTVVKISEKINNADVGDCMILDDHEGEEHCCGKGTNVRSVSFLPRSQEKIGDSAKVVIKQDMKGGEHKYGFNNNKREKPEKVRVVDDEICDKHELYEVLRMPSRCLKTDDSNFLLRAGGVL
ncbi:hypothetical protein JHK82_028081 [Glycine max]|nr:hypothetical protein JHK82_028081 [Glycine max]